jgi:hypothetical protein
MFICMVYLSEASSCALFSLSRDIVLDGCWFIVLMLLLLLLLLLTLLDVADGVVEVFRDCTVAVGVVVVLAGIDDLLGTCCCCCFCCCCCCVGALVRCKFCRILGPLVDADEGWFGGSACMAFATISFATSLCFHASSTETDEMNSKTKPDAK